MRRAVSLVISFLMVVMLSACSVDTSGVNNFVQNMFDKVGGLFSSEVEEEKAERDNSDWPDKESDRPLYINKENELDSDSEVDLEVGLGVSPEVSSEADSSSSTGPDLSLDSSESGSNEDLESRPESGQVDVSLEKQESLYTPVKVQFALRGKVQDKVYLNPWLGIKINLGDDWTAISDNQIPNLSGEIRPDVGTELIPSDILSGFIDFSANSSLGGKIVVRFDMTDYTEEKDYIDYLIGIPERIPSDAKVKINPVPISVGGEWYGFTYSLGESGVHVSTEAFVRIINKVAVVITQTGTSKSSTDLIDIFEGY